MSLTKMTPGQRGGIPRRVRIKKDDRVRVIAGKDKGKEGRVLEVIAETGRVLVEHCGMIKRHTRPNPAKQIKGGIAERESPIHVSNVMLLTSGGIPTRIGTKMEVVGQKTRRLRMARKNGEVLDKK
jgi:large subunit ribosomal protein L24